MPKDPYHHTKDLPQYPPKPFGTQSARSRSPKNKHLSKKSFDNYVETISHLNQMRGTTGELFSEKLEREQREK